MAGIQFELFKVRSRALRPLSMRRLAKLIGVDHTTIWNWENGESNRIDFDVLGRLCTVLSKQLGERVGPEHLLRRNKGRQSAAEHKVHALLAKCRKEKFDRVAYKLSDAVEAAECEDAWTAILDAYAAGTVAPSSPESTQQLQPARAVTT